jgi:signal transduction histidine kinase
VRADSAQLEQLLINLIRNAVDASLENQGGVEVAWTRPERQDNRFGEG